MLRVKRNTRRRCAVCKRYLSGLRRVYCSDDCQRAMLLGAVSIQRRIDEAKAERNMTKTCAVCGGIVGKGRAKYCSEACAKDAERRAMAQYMVVYRRREGNSIKTNCAFCGNETTRGMYCSRECELKQQRAVFGSALRERGA